MTSHQALRQLCREHGVLLHLPAANQLYVRITEVEALHTLGRHLRDRGFYLVTLASTDERQLVGNCFKLTYLFSHPTDDLFLFLEHALPAGTGDDGSAALQPDLPAGSVTFPSLVKSFASTEPFEREMADLMGLYPDPQDQPGRVCPGAWLHVCYPPGLYPLRRDRTQETIHEAIAHYRDASPEPAPRRPPDGEWLLPVGPVHAGVIEPGRFLFRLAGEVVEEVTIRRGYTHKGIERLFQTDYVLADGWRLAEHVSGDSAFAHSLAYCLAAEALAGVRPSPQANLLRCLFLELERLANHVGDCGALAHDVAHDVAATELAALRERLLALNDALAGHRLLRGLNRPGGIVLPHPPDTTAARATVSEVAARFADLALALAQSPAVRDRLQWIGILTRQQALDLGATGLVGRASGLRHDFRLQHPTGPYRDKIVREIVARGLPPDDNSIEALEATAGDSLARFLIRVREVQSSATVVDHVLARLSLEPGETQMVTPAHFRPERNFEFGLGCVEGWRGNVVYWLVQDKFGQIFRCKVCDPSPLNWPALKAAVEPHELGAEYVARHKPPRGHADSILPDFPVINKSFNLSYSGHDL